MTMDFNTSSCYGVNIDDYMMPSNWKDLPPFNNLPAPTPEEEFEFLSLWQQNVKSSSENAMWNECTKVLVERICDTRCEDIDDTFHCAELDQEEWALLENLAASLLADKQTQHDLEDMAQPPMEKGWIPSSAHEDDEKLRGKPVWGHSKYLREDAAAHAKDAAVNDARSDDEEPNKFHLDDMTIKPDKFDVIDMAINRTHDTNLQDMLLLSNILEGASNNEPRGKLIDSINETMQLNQGHLKNVVNKICGTPQQPLLNIIESCGVADKTRPAVSKPQSKPQSDNYYRLLQTNSPRGRSALASASASSSASAFSLASTSASTRWSPSEPIQHNWGGQRDALDCAGNTFRRALPVGPVNRPSTMRSLPLELRMPSKPSSTDNQIGCVPGHVIRQSTFTLSSLHSLISHPSQPSSMDSLPMTPTSSLEMDSPSRGLFSGAGDVTLIVRGIPLGYMQSHLMEVWNPNVLHFNFLSLPYSKKQHRSASYCFINFPRNKAAEAFSAALEGRYLEKMKLNGDSVLPLQVSLARVQGFDENMLLAAKNIQNLKFPPEVFDDYWNPMSFWTTLRSMEAAQQTGPA